MKRGWFVDYAPRPTVRGGNEKLQRLNFGKRARHKARVKKWWMYAWVVSVIAAAAGIPGTGINFLSLGNGRVEAAGIGAVNEVEGFRTEFQKRPLPRETYLRQLDDWTEEEIIQTIYAAASEFGLSWDYLLGVAKCESSLNMFAFNEYGYHGLFQFDFTTWEAYGYGSIYNPEAQARTAARLLAAGQQSRWPNCG